MSDDEDLKIETEHVEYWESGLNSLCKQFEIIIYAINLYYNLKDKRIYFTEKIKSNYINQSKQFKKEPSQIFFLSQIYFDFYSYLGNKMNKETKKIIITTIKEIINDLEQTKNETCNETLILITKCKDLIINIKKQEEEYKKAKTALDDAMIYQKKVKNEDKYTYNAGKKDKADLLLSEKIKDMEKIKNPFENNKKELSENRNKLNLLIKNNFEIIVSVCFKALSIYYQCLYLILNQRIEILNNLKGKLDDILIQLSNLVFDMNDFSEKRFGEVVLGIKTEGINIFSSSELINKSSMKQLIEISNNIINYVKIFLICLRYRKKIMKFFSESISKMIDFESDIKKLYNEGKRESLIKLDNLKIINNSCQRFLRNIISKGKINDIIKEVNSINSVINNYIEFVRNEYKTFMKNWEPYEDKLNERIKLSNDFLNEISEIKRLNKKINQIELINRNDKKMNKLKNAILTSVDFIQKNVISTREKDKNEMMKLKSTFEKMFLNCQNLNNEVISNMENEFNNAAMTDIFEECKIFITKYFNRFKIQNYNNFIERIKMELLINTDLSQGKLGKLIYGRITNEIESQIELSKAENTIDDLASENISSELYFQKSRRQSSLYLKPDQTFNPFNPTRRTTINNINDNQILSNSMINKINYNTRSNKTSTKSLATFSNIKFENNNNIISEKEKEKENISNINNINNNDSDSIDETEKISNNEILNELENEDKLQFITDAQISKYTEAIDPYSNIKEEEFDRLLNLKKKDSELGMNLEEGEKILDSFSCSLSGQILSIGTLTITTKKVEYKSSFIKKQRIIIPLGDVISVKKKSSLGIDTAIQIKTEKVTYLFTSFISRDHCYVILKNQINKYKEENNNKKNENKEEEKNEDANGPEQKYLKKKKFKAKQITKMLEEIEFKQKMEEYTNERMELFSKQYYDGKKGIFAPQKDFKYKFVEATFEDCPLFIPFFVLCNVNSKLEEYKTQKGFFESLFTERGDTEVKFEESAEFSKNIPQYFSNGDYVMNIFTQFNKDDILDFMKDINNWSHKYESNCYSIHKVKKIPFGPERVIMKNRYITYFISPTCLIFDDLSYATGFQFCDNFMPLFRYKFDCNIKFNESKCKFEFVTKMAIFYTTIFFADFWLKSAVESKSKGDTEQFIKGEVIDKLKDSFKIYINKFKEIFDRSTEETFQRRIDLKQNMITGEIEEEQIDGIEDEEKNEEEEKKEENENKEEIKEEPKEKNGNEKINEFIDKYKMYIFIGIICFTLLGIIHSFLSQKAGTFTINTIFNLVILGAIFYLFKFK